MLLNGVMIVQWVRSGNGSERSKVPTAGMRPEVQAECPAFEHPAPVSHSRAGPGAFQWQQLDAPDFATYVANLRKIGCPEATIRDIVDGELREIYARQAVGGGNLSDVSSPLDSEAERLGILSALLSGGAASGAFATAQNDTSSGSEGADGLTAGFSASEDKSATTGDASVPPLFAQVIDQVPAAFRIGNQGAGGAPIDELVLEVTDDRLTPDTAEQISRMRQDFADAVTAGGEAADPAAPGYFKQWMKAKRDSDDRFSSMYGGDAMDALYRKSLLEAVTKDVQTPSR